MAPKIESRNGEFVVTGNCSLFEALRAIAGELDKSSDRQLKLAKVCKESRDNHGQAEAEVRCEELIARTKTYLTACEQLPSHKRTHVERMVSMLPVSVEDNAHG